MAPLRPVFFGPMADRDDEQGVLGNLPRSRPGRRSDKRGGGSAARAKKTPAAAAKPAASKRTPRPSTPKRKPAAKPRATTQTRTQPRPAPAAASKSGSDPLGQAVQLAGKVAAIGVRTAADIVKRLPRR
jgi:hypothetical protein